MIDTIQVRNFKCLRDVSIDLEPFTMFVGANGSGKTSILQALDLLCRTFRVQPGQLDGEYQANRTHGTTEAVELSCRSGELHFRYRTNTQPHLAPRNRNWAGEGAGFATDGSPSDWKQWQQQNGTLPNPVWLRLDLNALRTVGLGQPNDPRIMLPNGQGLHSATASMNLEDPDLWLKLQEDLRRIVPAVRRLRHTPQNELLFDTINGKGLTAQQMSEGTLLTLGLLTAIHGVNRPGVLLLDDLDRALHPKAQRELIDLLRGVQTTNPEIQIVGSTHSPYLLDCMKANEVRMTQLSDDGSTVCAALSRHPKFQKWKNEMHSGELWSMFGEKWVTEQGAPS
jgi:predicted ATPase